MVSEVRYHPYGQERWSKGATPTDFGFTSQRNEASFGLMDYNARYYSPVLGRFVSRIVSLPAPPRNDDYTENVFFLHLTTSENADNILNNDLQPIAASQSRNDPRFFGITQESGPYPRPSNEQVTDMLSDIATQLNASSPRQSRELVRVRIPRDDVTFLEDSGLIHYGPFFPISEPGYTESIFEEDAFPIVNQHKHLWDSVLIN